MIYGEFAEDFGQKVDLTQHIREVLANYPEGTTILKQLIQNADDARATQVTFCLDRRQHGTESLAYGPLIELFAVFFHFCHTYEVQCGLSLIRNQ